MTKSAQLINSKDRKVDTHPLKLLCGLRVNGEGGQPFVELCLEKHYRVILEVDNRRAVEHVWATTQHTQEPLHQFAQFVATGPVR